MTIYAQVGVSHQEQPAVGHNRGGTVAFFVEQKLSVDEPVSEDISAGRNYLNVDTQSKEERRESICGQLGVKVWPIND